MKERELEKKKNSYKYDLPWGRKSTRVEISGKSHWKNSKKSTLSATLLKVKLWEKRFIGKSEFPKFSRNRNFHSRWFPTSIHLPQDIVEWEKKHQSGQCSHRHVAKVYSKFFFPNKLWTFNVLTDTSLLSTTKPLNFDLSKKDLDTLG